MHSFSIKEALSFGWKTTWDNFKFFLSLLAIAFVVCVAFNGLFALSSKAGPSILPIGLGMAILGIVMKIGWLRITLDFVHGDKMPAWNDLFSHYSLFFPFILASILYNIIIAVGSVLLIIPGIIAALMLGFYGYGVVDKNLAPLEALTFSRSITYGAKWKLLGFYILLGLINLAGALVLLIGLLVTLPLSALAHAHVYQQLAREKTSESSTPNTSSPTLPL